MKTLLVSLKISGSMKDSVEAFKDLQRAADDVRAILFFRSFTVNFKKLFYRFCKRMTIFLLVEQRNS